jgi:predicted dehydrogenase
LIDQGAIGNAVLAEANFSLPGTLTPEKWRFYRETCPGGPLMQLGVHHADTLQYWLGPVESISGSFSRMATSAEIDDVGIASLRFASGALGTITSSYVSPKTYWLRLYGTEGNLHYQTDMSIWPNAEQMDSATMLTLTDKSGKQTPIEFETCDMLHDQLDEFARCVRGETGPETGSQEAVAALSVIRGALESHEAGRAISVEEL